MKSNRYKLQFITHHTDRYSYLDSVRIALEGGCRWVQLRMKGADEALMEQTAIAAQQMCREHGATFIIDDDVALAKRIGADGVHLGKMDMPISEARRVLGEGYIIGATVNSFEDVVRTLQNSTPDYFGCGPYRYTSTKQNLSPILGNKGYRDIIGKMREHNIAIPLIAIGGITKSDIPELLMCGVDGIALSGSIINAEDPIEEMRDIAEILLK
jgi:thiamine-phosphate pyrophosphorylase